MATKTNLISTINGWLTAIITQAKVRSAALETVNEIYPTVLNETQSVNTFTTPSNATDYQYNISFIKQGRLVTVYGTVKNNTAAIVSNVSIFSFTGEFEGRGGIFNASNGSECTLFSSEFQVLGVLGAGETIKINFNYFTYN